MSQIISQSNALAEHIYQKLKQEIFDFYLLPHDRFTETQIAERFEVSRTPVRDALYGV
ncbi:GntR family transcriptional regulator [Klebsiella pneumoniae]|uniref:GntR family transcriptional regulator n=1 Tax=Klebsiella pneumoniae TaxID=573 RepID=UPI0037DDC5BA